ncbi:glycosyltransferase [Flavobacterium sp.]|uniref:glycosyltransferase n=1 Tax=Flavobacterium sp. TaxID=239 RepID=UPI002488CCED|nr:glycosyltransferase [Flavobacterium sp.]MDI1318520.1 glycosyltransferase [Flavobacterium sp.]
MFNVEKGCKRAFFILQKIIKRKDYYYFKGLKKNDLIIYDDIFPHPVSGFRLEELTVLLTEFEKSKIIISSKSYSVLKSSISDNKKHIETFVHSNKDFKRKLLFRKGLININAKLFYCIFINNIYENLYWLEKYNIPFVFTLYPGGGFQMNDELTNSKLKRVLSSTLFRKVIVTQSITRDYLLKNDFCNQDKIEFIFGCVVPQNSLIKNLASKKYYSQGKSTLDICFCAAKYMPKGIDKGYDVFIEVAHALSKKCDFVQFHVIGDFDQNDIDVSEIKENITFYGYQNFDELGRTFQKIDIIISPNKPFALDVGSFDGFPLGTVVEAALNGVMVLLSDELHQNTTFVNNDQLVIIKSDSKSIENVMLTLIENPNKIIEIAINGRIKFQEVYSNKVQMKPRIELLKQYIN